MNSEYFVALARTFEERYGVEFAGIRQGPVTDPRERLIQFKTNIDVVMSVLERENLVRAMISGTKPALRHPGARNARAPRAAALLFACAVVGATAYAVLQYDRQAFTLRSAESAERSADAAGRLTTSPIDED